MYYLSFILRTTQGSRQNCSHFIYEDIEAQKGSGHITSHILLSANLSPVMAVEYLLCSQACINKTASSLIKILMPVPVSCATLEEIQCGR